MFTCVLPFTYSADIFFSPELCKQAGFTTIGNTNKKSFYYQMLALGNFFVYCLPRRKKYEFATNSCFCYFTLIIHLCLKHFASKHCFLVKIKASADAVKQNHSHVIQFQIYLTNQIELRYVIVVGNHCETVACKVCWLFSFAF